MPSVFVMRAGRASTTISDTFDRASSTSTISPASDGGTWTVDSATWGISSNQGYVANGVGGNGNWIRRDLGGPATDISCDFLIPVGFSRNVWMSFAGNGPRVGGGTWTGYELGGFDGTFATGLTLVAVRGGVVSTIISRSPATWQGTTKTIRVTNDGAGHFELFFNGSSIGTGMDPGGAALTGSWVHLGTSETAGAGTVRFDNFTATG